MMEPQTLSDWLSTYAKPLPETHWVARLKASTWDLGETALRLCDIRDRGPEEQRAQVGIPPKCLIMNSFENEFQTFGAEHALVRSEYFKILDCVIAFAKEDEYERAGDIDVEDPLFLDHIPDNPFNSTRITNPKNIIITGSPGNGKSIFLHLLLRLRLNAGLPTLLQVDPESAVLVTEHGAHELDRTTLEHYLAPAFLRRFESTMWCLVDSNRFMQTPSAFVSYTGCTIVQTPSPRVPRMDWVKKSTARMMRFCTAPFALEEAIVACQFQQQPIPHERQLEYWYQRFTPSIRTALDHGHDPQSYEDEIKMELQSVLDATTLGTIGTAVNCANIPPHQHTPYEIFLYYPAENRRFTSVKVAIPTAHLVSLIIDRFDANTTAKRLELYRTWFSIEPLAAATERLLRHLVQEALPKGGVYPLKKLEIKENPVNYHWIIPNKSPDYYFLMDCPSPPDCYLVIDGSAKHTVTIATEKPHGTCSPVQIKSYENLESDVLADGAFYASSATAPTFDFIHVRGHKAVLFQCTVSGQRAVKKVRLDEVSGLAKKLGIKEMVYIGVVPEGKESTTFAIKKEVVGKIPFKVVEQYLLPYEPVQQP